MADYMDYGFKTDRHAFSHKHSIPKIESFLNKEQNKLILDVGCGNGALANYFIGKGYQVYGIDASETGIAIANQKNKGHFFVQDISSKKLPETLQNMKFDTIISTEVIEHLYDPGSYITFCKNILLKKGHGVFIISTPYHGYLKNLVLALTNNMDNHFTALWHGGHIKFWSKKR